MRKSNLKSRCMRAVWAGLLLAQAVAAQTQPFAVDDPVTPALPGITAGGLVIEWVDPHSDEAKLAAGGGSTATDAAGRSYVGGDAGIEVSGKSGDLLGVIPLPVKVERLAFAGPGNSWLYVAGGDAVYRFRTLTSGASEAR